MENWRRRTIDNNRVSSDESRRRSMTKKPPRAANWQPSVPYWEKKFCKAVSGLDWDTILHRKKFVHLYDNVLNWNDSAGKESFHNAKKRFLAQMRGWPCEISSPSPDLYIDKVDWDAEVDLQQLLELDDETLVPNKPGVHDEHVIDFGDTFICNLGLSPAGWGDEDKIFKKATKLSWNNEPVSNQGWSPWNNEPVSWSPGGWGDEEENFRKATKSSWNNYDNEPVSNQGLSPGGWGDEEANFGKATKSTWNNYDNEPVSNQGLSPSGWGDEEANFRKATKSSWNNHNNEPVSNQGLSPSGWGDEEENFRKATKSSWNNHNNEPVSNRGLAPAGWGDELENFRKATSSWNNYYNSWEQKQRHIEKTTMEKGCEVLVDTRWGDSWLEMKATENNGVPGAWQVGNGGPYETSYGSSRLMNSNNYNKGRNKWSNGKREMMV